MSKLFNMKKTKNMVLVTDKMIENHYRLLKMNRVQEAVQCLKIMVDAISDTRLKHSEKVIVDTVLEGVFKNMDLNLFISQQVVAIYSNWCISRVKMLADAN